MRRITTRTVATLAVTAALAVGVLPAGSAAGSVRRAAALPPCPLGALQKAKKPVQITLERELPEELQEYESRNFSAEEAKKEELRIVEAIASDGASVKRSFELVLDSIGGDLGYWLDNGGLSVA